MPRYLPILLMAVCGANLTTFAFAAEQPTFEKDVRPILKTHCFACHGEAGEMEGGLDLRLRRLMVAGGDSGPAITPGDLEDSVLLDKVIEQEMPPGDTKLSDKEIDVLRRWISAGAKTARPEPENLDPASLITEEERNFWAFQPIRDPQVPVVQHADDVQTPIDAFLLRRLEEKNLAFAPAADKQTLIRRAYFDLIGLPPTPQQVQNFINDTAPDAYEKVLDELLASPHYGERWGRHWLDVAGYADSEGFAEVDQVRNHAYKYRDYIIRAFNADKPFDRLIVEQLAGDELVPMPHRNLTPEQIDILTATGFLRMAPDGTGSSGVDQPVARNQVIADTIKIVSTSLMGMSVGCAECHDHRYDPIPQTDYYRMRSIFEPAYDWKKWRSPRGRLLSLYTDDDRKQAADIEAKAKVIDAQRTKKQNEFIQATLESELAKLPEELRETVRAARETPAAKRTAEQQKLLKEHPSVNVSAGSLYLYDRKAADELKKMSAEAAKIRATKPKEEFVRILSERPGQVPSTHLFYRGEYAQPKQALAPAGLTVISWMTPTKIPVNDATRPTTGRRLAFAKQLTDGNHPLTARVLINRVWAHHFGRGIVGSLGDFGVLGDRPTHPDLLDWLASDFMQGGWRLKRMHKMMMLSTAYRQSSKRRREIEMADPDNLLYGRMSIRRLEAEVLRDSMLAVSGKLNTEQFGPPVPVREDEVGQIVVGIDTTDSAGRPTGKAVDLKGKEFRRSVYIQVRRSQPLAVLDAFDAPIMEPNCEARTPSTVAPQALMLMNSNFTISLAEHFAQRIAADAGAEPTKRAALAWRLAFSVEPSESEQQAAVDFLNDQAEHFKSHKIKDDKTSPEDHALAVFCQALFSTNRFLYVD
ncbi:PSD1 and planctomycete cytochrome C domain-containing protein [Symmachiella dynata]|mgnify:CR=1 FL=1|uniref:PSD1 and planctomycete cytochrome C domain-containing protein n=1 Tax=Symmachiella dynata TaxID=2527995 RepID=UPI0030ED277B